MSRQLWLNVFVVWILFPMAASQAQQSPSDWRTWSSADKRFTVEAKFAGVDSTKICLERKQDGKTIEVPADKLSDADWAWLGPKLDPSVVAQQVALAQDQLAAARKDFAGAVQHDPTYQTAQRAVEKGRAKMVADTQQIINYLRHLHTSGKGNSHRAFTIAGVLLEDFESYDRGLRGEKDITEEKLKDRLNHDELTFSNPEERRVVSNVTRDFDAYLKDRDETAVAEKHLQDVASGAADEKLSALKLALARWESCAGIKAADRALPGNETKREMIGMGAFIDKLNAAVSGAVTKSTTAQRSAAFNQGARDLNQETNGRTVEFRFPISDVVPDQSRYLVRLSEPNVGKALAPGKWNFRGAILLDLSSSVAAAANPGDTLVLIGSPRVNFTALVSRPIDNPSDESRWVIWFYDADNSGQMQVLLSRGWSHRIERLGQPTLGTAGKSAITQSDDHRTKWLNSSYGSTLRPTGEKKWAEFDNRTGRLLVSWEETGRTAELIELFCPDRQQKIRVSSGKMELFKDDKWIWVANGRWTDGQTNLHAQSHRTAWLNTSYDLTLRPTGEKKWAEFENKTGRLHLSYDETGRTDESIELFCPERQQKVRVFAERMELFKDGKWQWVANGKWSEGQVRDREKIT